MATPQKIRCRVESVRPFGRGVHEAVLAPDRAMPRFRAGQFLHLALDAYDPSGFWPDSRVFSIASAPEKRDRATILYSVKGAFTGRMERELAPGREVWIKLPYGDFDFTRTGKDLVLIAGGTGISAFAARIESMGDGRRVLLCYGARAPELLIWRDRFDAVKARCAAFDALYFAERAGDAPDAAVIPGTLDLDRIFSRLEDPGRRAFYLSGPPAMLTAFRTDLTARGIAPGDIFTDNWE